MEQDEELLAAQFDPSALALLASSQQTLHQHEQHTRTSRNTPSSQQRMTTTGTAKSQTSSSKKRVVIQCNDKPCSARGRYQSGGSSSTERDANADADAEHYAERFGYRKQLRPASAPIARVQHNTQVGTLTVSLLRKTFLPLFLVGRKQ